VSILSFEREKDAGHRRKSDQPVEAKANSRQSKKKGTGDVGNALRSVYQRTVEERIPPDLLDLLGKLG
jgi:hypothetical protein